MNTDGVRGEAVVQTLTRRRSNLDRCSSFLIGVHRRWRFLAVLAHRSGRFGQ